MSKYLVTIVQRKLPNSSTTTFLLRTEDGKHKGIAYSTPLNMPALGVGDRIEFLEGCLTEGEGVGARITHGGYHSAAFYQAKKRTPFLQIEGKYLAALAKVMGEEMGRDAANERESMVE